MEYIDIVDKNNEVVGKVSREDSDFHAHISRNVIVHIQDKDGQYIVCKRAPHKKIEPNLYDAAVCGFVRSGESYEEAAQRELLEELGMSCPLNFLTVFYNEFDYGGTMLRHFTGVFSGKSNEKILLSDEVTEYKKFSADKLLKLAKIQPALFTKCFLKEISFVEQKM